MCGILAVISKEPLNRRCIKESLDSLQRIKHRGPDGEGLMLINTLTGEKATLRTKDIPASIFCDYQELAEIPEDKFNLLLGHRRLSIIDLSIQGHQPMLFDNVAITFNGEIYNYIEIREELKAKGRVFSTNSDTEVIIQAYLEWGEKCLNRFNGMWSFVLWDNHKKELFISNDRFGVKPLYYSSLGENNVFTSEIKQFLDFSHFNRILNDTYFEDYLNTGTTQIGLSTPFKEVSRFPNGHFSILKQFGAKAALNFNEYYSIYQIKSQKWKEADAIQAFRELFFDAVKLRTRADVPYGVGLSGGLDSSSILKGVEFYLKERNNGEIPFTFSAIFPGEKEDESIHVAELLKTINTNQKTVDPFNPFDYSEFFQHVISQEVLPPNSAFFSQWKVAQLAKSNGVKVLLVGQGADEVFAGYHAHFYKYMTELLGKRRFVSLLRNVLGHSKIKDKSKKDLLVNSIFEWVEVYKTKNGRNNSFLAKNSWYDYKTLTDFLKLEFSKFQLPYYLLSDDRTAMSNSVETRHPFLDYRLVEFGYSLPPELLIKNGWQKYLVREAMFELPKKIAWRKDKKGFSSPLKSLVDSNNIFFGNGSNQETLFRRKTIDIWNQNFMCQ